jgi:hypothetical protein
MDLIDDLRAAVLRIPTMGNRAALEPVASPIEVAEFEHRVGLSLSPLWRRVYTEVGNGGFGPGYGLLGLVAGARTDEGNSAAEFVELLREPDPEDQQWKWPVGLVPICHWGCAIYSCLDLRADATPVVRFDPNGHGPGTGWEGAWWRESLASEIWLRAWIEGTLKFNAPAA